MHPKTFIEQLDDDKIIAAIARAERESSGEIHVCISHKRRADAMAAAQNRFRKLGLHRTRHRNAILIYFAPHTRQFAIWGDAGVHEKCGDQFWQDIVTHITPLLKNGQFTDAIVEAVRRTGEVLAQHFPRDADSPDAPPNAIVRE